MPLGGILNKEIIVKFSEAMEKLKSGSKVTRGAWGKNVYFMMIGNEVKSVQPKLSHYIYNEDIMVSDGWTVDKEGTEKEYKFCDIIPFLQKGAKAKLKDWEECFIYLDVQSKSLVLHAMESIPFVPNFESFAAQDWIEIE